MYGETNPQGGQKACDRVGVLLDMDKGEMRFFRGTSKDEGLRPYFQLDLAHHGYTSIGLNDNNGWCKPNGFLPAVALGFETSATILYNINIIRSDSQMAGLPSGPMAAFNNVAVLAWLGTVPGMTSAQRAATAEEMVKDEYDGYHLVSATTKTLRRLLKGTEVEGAVPLLLAARNDHLAVQVAETAAAATAEAAAAATAVAEAEQRAAAEAGLLAPPDEFVCAISQQLMVDPVTADDGTTAIRDCHRPGSSSFAITRHEPI
jgi:hypothetical protein